MGGEHENTSRHPPEQNCCHRRDLQLKCAILNIVQQISDSPAASGTSSANDSEIDHQVYALYGLTPEEIKIVEDSAGKA